MCRLYETGPKYKHSTRKPFQYVVVLWTYFSKGMLGKEAVAHLWWLRILNLAGLRFLYGHE